MHLSLQGGQTALMIAYDFGHIECAKVLVDKGAQVNIQDTVSLSGVIIHYMQCNNMSWNLVIGEYHSHTHPKSLSSNSCILH